MQLQMQQFTCFNSSSSSSFKLDQVKRASHTMLSTVKREIVREKKIYNKNSKLLLVNYLEERKEEKRKILNFLY